MNFDSKFWSSPGTIAVPVRLLVFRFLFFWFRFGFVFVLLSVDWNILLMSRFGHAQFSQPIRVLPDTINQSESLMSRLIRIENPRSAKLFKFKPETLICEKLFSKNSCLMTVNYPKWNMIHSFKLSIALLPVKTITSGWTPYLSELKACCNNFGIYSETNKENHGTLMIYFYCSRIIKPIWLFELTKTTERYRNRFSVLKVIIKPDPKS